jgi:hypothetical protein
VTIDVKGIVAVLVVVGSFGLIGVYVVQGKTPDTAILAVCGTSLGLVLGFYFGHINGAATALANSATELAAQAIAAATARRAGDVTVTGPAAVVPVAVPVPIPPVTP